MENNENKRRFILAAHRASGEEDTFHLFQDVAMFDFQISKGESYCFTCHCSHKIPQAVDVLVSGPSCKNLSKMFQHQAHYKDCFLACQMLPNIVQYIAVSAHGPVFTVQ